MSNLPQFKAIVNQVGVNGSTLGGLTFTLEENDFTTLKEDVISHLTDELSKTSYNVRIFFNSDAFSSVKAVLTPPKSVIDVKRELQFDVAYYFLIPDTHDYLRLAQGLTQTEAVPSDNEIGVMNYQLLDTMKLDFQYGEATNKENVTYYVHADEMVQLAQEEFLERAYDFINIFLLPYTDSFIPKELNIEDELVNSSDEDVEEYLNWKFEGSHESTFGSTYTVYNTNKKTGVQTELFSVTTSLIHAPQIKKLAI